jgi:hypothetical protein
MTRHRRGRKDLVGVCIIIPEMILPDCRQFETDRIARQMCICNDQVRETEVMKRDYKIGIRYMGTGNQGKDQKEEQERKTYLFGIVAGACLYVCRLSLFNFEKHARAGNNIAKNESETQKAIISFSQSLYKCPSSKLDVQAQRLKNSLFLSQSNSSASCPPSFPFLRSRILNKSR